MEADAIRRVFGAGPPPVSAIKSMIGHTMGAAGAHASIAAVLGMLHDFIPPTINFATPDPDCPIDCVPNVARDARLDTVVVNSLGLGGNNCAIALRRPEDL
jgi:3-oxoacyl-[acyl-carrier-protein] synthase II